MKTLRVEGHDKLSKDAHSGGIINNDTDSLAAARAARRKILEDKQKISSLEQRVNDLEQLFKKLLGDVNGNST